MLDFIYHMSLKSHFWNERGHDFAIFYATFNERHYVTLLSCSPLVVYLSYCMALYYSQTRLHVIAKTMVLMNIAC